MTGTESMDTKACGGLARVLERPLLASSPILSSSPMATQIIYRDLAECSSPEDGMSDCGSDVEYDFEPKPDYAHFGGADNDDDDDNAASRAGPSSGLYLRPSGITYGTMHRPSIAPQPPPTDNFLPSEREWRQAIDAERSLLRDNHILPPKHRRSAHESTFKALYRSMFSTKVRMPALAEDGLLPDTLVKAAETTPLLHRVPSTQSLSMASPSTEIGHELFEEAVAAKVLTTTWQREVMTLVQYARSLAATFLLHYSVTVASIYTVGRIGSLELGAVSLATMSANITCYAVVQGLSTSLDTLCAQAYGSGHKHLVGLQLQRMTYFLWLLLLPICTLWWFSEPVLAFLVPDPETARLASSYLRVLILGTPGVAAFESGKRFVQAQGLFHATTYVLLLGAPLSFAANWFFVWKLGWQFTGAGIAVVCTQNLLPLLLAAYVFLFEGRECWNGLSRKAFRNWEPMIRLALPGMIMVVAQYIAFEVLTLSASRFGTKHLAAQSILVTMTSTTFQVPFALSIAASTRVANLVGARLTSAAHTCARVAVVAACVVGLTNAALLLITRWSLPHLFTNDSAVADIVVAIAPTCALLQVFDALAACSHGLLRGIGRQSVGGYANLFSYYLIGLPIALALGFGLGWAIKGLWIGVMCGLVAVAIIEYSYICQYDWERAVEDAESRMAGDAGTSGEMK